MIFTTGWTREYVLDTLTFAQVFRYYEYAQEYMADMAQMIAIEVGLTCGFCKRKDEPYTSYSSSQNMDVAGDGVQELLLANLGGQKKWQP